MVEHLVCLIVAGAAGYVKRIRLARCRQANARKTGSNAINISYLISGQMPDWG
jgi:hypothetical protein